MPQPSFSAERSRRTLSKPRNHLLDQLESFKADRFPTVEIRGPVPAPLAKIRNKFRWLFLLRSEDVEELRELIRCAVAEASPTNIDLIVGY